MPAHRLAAYFDGPHVAAERVPVLPETYQVLCPGHDVPILAEHEDLPTMLRVLKLAEAQYELGLLPEPPMLRLVCEGDPLMDGGYARSSGRRRVPLSELAERVRNLRDAGLPDDFVVPDPEDFVTPGGIRDEPRTDTRFCRE